MADIYDYESYISFLNSLLSSGQSRPRSISAFAKLLGYRSHRTLGMVINGDRPPSARLTERIAEFAKLDVQERAYLRLLARSVPSRQGGKADIQSELFKLNPKKSAAKTLSDEETRSIGSWYSLPVKQLVECSDFVESAEWIAKRLGFQITAQQAQHALDDLLESGLIYRNELGKLVVGAKATTTSRDRSSEYIRRYHRQVLQRSCRALEDHPKSRDFTATTLRMRPEKLAKAKEALDRFKKTFVKEFHDMDGDELFQFNQQFYTLTRFRGVGPNE